MTERKEAPVVTFHSWPCRIQKGKYYGGNLALVLVHADTGETIVKATLNPEEDVALAKDEVVVKNYSENEGMLETLLSAGLVEETGRTVTMPYGSAMSVCRVLF